MVHLIVGQIGLELLYVCLWSSGCDALLSHFGEHGLATDLDSVFVKASLNEAVSVRDEGLLLELVFQLEQSHVGWRQQTSLYLLLNFRWRLISVWHYDIVWNLLGSCVLNFARISTGGS